MWEKLAERVAERLIEKKVNELMKGNNKSNAPSSDNWVSGDIAEDGKPNAQRSRGSSGWKDPELGLLPSKAETVVLDIGLPIAGDIAKATGNILGNNASLLGAALNAIRIGGGNTLTGNNMNNFGLASAAGLGAKGMNEKLIGDVASNRLYDIASTLKTERAQARNKAFQINEQAPGLFWQEQRKNAPVASGFKKDKE